MMSLNLIVGWIGIVLGVVGGFALGLNFHRDEWLGGYQSLKRRLYRLSHIALFGLGLLNLAFTFTVVHLGQPSDWVGVASWGFVIGAIAMPICCLLMAHWPRLRAVFAIPVISLFVGSLLTLIEVIRS